MLLDNEWLRRSTIAATVRLPTATQTAAAERQVSARAVVLVGVIYAVIGVVFAWPENHVRVWRLAAWLVSAAAYTTHIGFEYSRMRTAPGRAALRVASAVALGAFGLALSATIHSLLVASTGPHRRLVLLALVVWPIMTGLPAFVVALAAIAIEGARRRYLASARTASGDGEPHRRAL